MLLQNPAHKKNVNAPIVEVDDDSQVFTGSDEVITIDQEVANTPVAFGSPSFVTSTTTNQNSQDSEVTVTLSSPSQKLVDDFELSEASKTFQEKEVQTEKGIFISEEEFERLRQKAETCADFKKDLHKLCIYFSSMLNQCPEMDPSEFEKICKHVGAEKLLKMLYDLMSSERMSDERKNLTKLRAMVVIYIMMYSHSQRANWFQVTLARTLQQFGISDQGLASLRNLGVAAHPRTVKAASQSSATLHLDNVVGFFQEVVENEHFLVFCIDDYHNIHTKHRPEEKTQTQAVHMSTLLVKVFPNVKAVSKGSLCTPLLPPIPVQHKHLFKLIEVNMAGLSQSYATNMPDWVLAKYFDPEAERHRLLLHDYQQTEIQKMRSMENTKLIDSLHMPLKSYKDILVAFNHMLSNGLEIYLEKFLAPFMGDWPTQFFMRQVVYNLAEVSLPDICQNVVPLIGPLHISLNSRECVLKFFHPIFAELYAILFGKKAKLAKKPQAWRVSLLLEVLYGGWTLVRESILSVFCFCKDIEFLTLVNLVDNYVPLVLSIYSIVFKCNDYELYCKSLLRIWAMFMVFHRRHYDKAMLVVLSHFMYWQENSHPMYHTLHQALAAFDEYPVENFHSLLRARTNATDSAEQISLKAKEIDCCKQEMQSFQSMFVPPKKFHFSQKSISNLKVKAAEFLTKKFEVLHDNPGQAVLLPRVRGQNKETTKWQLPNLFGSMIVTNRVLPLGFSSLDRPPNPTM